MSQLIEGLVKGVVLPFTSIFKGSNQNSQDEDYSNLTVAEKMAKLAMSDNMTIGPEQIIVSLTLLAISLYCMAKPRSRTKLREFVQMYLGFLPFRRNIRSFFSWKRWTNRHQNNQEEQHDLSGENLSSPISLRKIRSTPFLSEPRLKTFSKQQQSSSSTTNSNNYTTFQKLVSTNNETGGNNNNDKPTIIETIMDSTTGGINDTTVNSPSSINSTNNIECEYEHFRRVYRKSHQFSTYKKLVLPPTCRLLDPKKLKEAQRLQQQREAGKYYDDEHGNIMMRLIYHPREVIVEIVTRIWEFDYMGTTYHFNYRIWNALVTRCCKILGWEWDPDDSDIDDSDEDDDEEEEDGDGEEMNDDSTIGSLSIGNNHYMGGDTGSNSGWDCHSPSSTPNSIQRGNSGGTGGSSRVSSGIKNVTTTTVKQTNSMGSIVNVIADGGGGGGEGNEVERERFYTLDTSLPHGMDDNNSYNNDSNSSTNPIKIVAKDHEPYSEDQSLHSLSGLSCEWDDKSLSHASSHPQALDRVVGENDVTQTQTLPTRSMSPLHTPLNCESSEEKKDGCSSSVEDTIESSMNVPSHCEVGNSDLPGRSLTPTEVYKSAKEIMTPVGDCDSIDSSKKPLSTGKANTTTTAAAASIPPIIPNIPRGSIARPQSPKRQIAQRQSIIKKKDALETYRSKHSTPVVANRPSSIRTSTPTAVPDIPVTAKGEKQKSTDLVYFDTATNDASLRQMVRSAPLPDREGYVLSDDLLQDPKNDTPLLVFVNTRSGSQQGPMLKSQLRRLLNPIQVWDLADGGPQRVLESFMVLTNLRVLVCGGDGTVSWIISALDKMKLERWPPIAILPLGTGNDLARIHGWGAGYANESLLLILNQVQESYISLLDRWKMIIDVKKKKRKVKNFTNYMSIGMDALSALTVHNLRENNPKLFFSRAVNKVWYTLFGFEDAVKASCSDLPQQVKIEADGVEVAVPADSQGLIILNIDSYLGGVPLWSRGVKAPSLNRRKRSRRYSDGDFFSEQGSFANPKRSGSFDHTDSVTGDEKDHMNESNEEKLERVTACDMPSSCQDGRLDVISIRGNFHLGQIRVGLSQAHLLCQCSKLKVTLKKKTAVQIDGEPWQQDRGTLRIVRKKDPAIMLHRATEEGGGIETEVAKLLDWAEKKKIIDRLAHGTLMREFSRRIESKTRARRVRSQETVFSTMSRAMSSQHKLSTMH